MSVSSSVVVAALLLCLVCMNVAFAADCGPLTATFTVTPPICKVAYNVPSSQQNNNTGGDLLATLFNGFTSLPSQACAEAYAVFYCNTFYPECAADNTTKGVCRDTCGDVLTACEGETAKFAAASLPLPEYKDCADLFGDPCSAMPTVDLSASYVDCAYVNNSKFYDIAPPTFTDGLITCVPNHTVPVGNMTYAGVMNILETLKPMGEVQDTIYDCIKAFSNYYCYNYFPNCPAPGSRVIQPVCKATCKKVQTTCADFADKFTINVATQLQIPTDAVCDSYPDTGCFTPPNSDTTLAFYFGTDPPTPPTVPPKVDGTTRISIPGSYAGGGGIGAGVLAGLLAIIGVLMLIMKKQDTR